MRTPYKIILAEDHLRLRREIKKILAEIPVVEVVGEAGEGGEVFELLDKMRPDLVLLDISMPNLRAMQATQAIKAKYPDVRVFIMVMDEESEYRHHAINAGADGVLMKENIAGDLGAAILKMRRSEWSLLGFHENKGSELPLKEIHRRNSAIFPFFMGIFT